MEKTKSRVTQRLFTFGAKGIQQPAKTMELLKMHHEMRKDNTLPQTSMGDVYPSGWNLICFPVGQKYSSTTSCAPVLVVIVGQTEGMKDFLNGTVT